MTDPSTISAESEARRLEAVNSAIANLLRRPQVAQRLRAAGPDEWSAVQILGHMNEMIAYWMSHVRALVAAAGDPPHFGRTLDAPERLDAVARATTSDPDELLRQLDDVIHAAAADIRALSPADWTKTGIHNRRGEMTVAAAIEDLIVHHAEDHQAQVTQALMTQTSSPDANKGVVRRVYEEFTNQRNLDLAAELFSPDFVDHGSPPERSGLEGVQATMRAFLAAFPDFQFTIEAIIADGDLVHVRGAISGTHLGAYAGRPASGKHARWSAMDDFRFADGKIVERWTERNRISQLRQLGALPG